MILTVAWIRPGVGELGLIDSFVYSFLLRFCM